MSTQSRPLHVLLSPSMLALQGVMGFSDGAPRSSAKAYRPRPRSRYRGVPKDEQQRRLFAAASKRERKRARAQGTGMVGGAR